MENRSENTYGNVTVIQRSDYKWGVVDLEGNEIVPFGKYDWIDGFGCGFARVNRRVKSVHNKRIITKWGMINDLGEEVVKVELNKIHNFYKKESDLKVNQDFEKRSVKNYGNVNVIQRSDYKWGVLDLQGNEIVPFSKYDWIDGFDSGLARVKIGKQCAHTECNNNKWGIINEQGEEVLKVEYDRIWNFFEKGRYSTKIIKYGEEREVYFYDLNPNLPKRGTMKYNIDNDDEYESNYGKYAGSYAQDIAGYSDEDISDAFEGDPDNYWNID